MSKVAFTGFPDGSTVTIGGVTVNAWGQLDIGGDVWGITPSSGTAVSITATRADHHVAPEPFYFEPVVTGFDTNTSASLDDYDPSYHDKVYFWDYGEGYDYTAPTQVLALDASDGGNRKDSRYSRGPEGAHAYRGSGAFVVRLAVYEMSSGKWGQGVFYIGGASADTPQIEDPEVYYASSTFILDDTGFGDFTTLEAAVLGLAGETTPHRVVVKRGQVFEESSSIRFDVSSTAASTTFRFEAEPGAGALPIFRTATDFSPDFAGWGLLADLGQNGGDHLSSAVMKDIQFEGRWDPITETGVETSYTYVVTGKASRTTLFDGCPFVNTAEGVNIITKNNSETRADRMFFAVDCAVDGWQNYAFYLSETGKQALLGCRMVQDVDANAGDKVDGPNIPENRLDDRNNHGPGRIPNPNGVVVLSCDMFSSNGWSDFAGSYNMQAIQPVFRIGTSGQISGSRVTMYSCVFEGAKTVLNIAAANDAELSVPRNVVADANVLIGGFQSDRLVNVSNGGLTFRNNILVFPDVDSDATSEGGQNPQPLGFFHTDSSYDWTLSSAANEAAPIIIEDNNLINLRSDGKPALFENAGGRFTSLTISNNIEHHPNISVPDTPFNPMTTSSLITPRYKGYKSNIQQTLLTKFATPTTTVTGLTPQTGSTALDVDGDQVVGAIAFKEDYRDN